MYKKNRASGLSIFLITAALSIAMIHIGAAEGFSMTSQKPKKPADEGFQAMSFDSALAAAKNNGKIVLVDFYTTWCGPCKMLDKTTWKDPKVIAWLNEKTVALKIDAEKDSALSGKYNVHAYPTIVFIKPDGNEIDRLVGYRKPEDFLNEAEGALSGKDSVARAKEKLTEDKKNDPMTRMNYAKALEQKGQHKEALEEYLWCYDQGMKHNPTFVGIRSSFLLSYIEQLGRTYPPAIEALKQRRDAAEQAVLSGDAKAESALDIASLNRTLREPDRTVNVYDKLKKEKPEAKRQAEILLANIIDQLLAKKRYNDILEDSGDIFARIDQFVRQHEQSLKANNEQLSSFMKENVAKNGGRYYEALIGGGRQDDAVKLAERLIAFNNSGKTFAVLITHALRAQDRQTAKALTDRALQTLPKAEHTLIEQANAAMQMD